MTGDQGLIQKAAAGDEEAFSELYHSYRDWVYRLAWRFLKDEGLAQDVAQETFVYLIKKLPSLQLTARMTTFLYPVVKNLCLNLLRARRPHDLDELRLYEVPVPENSCASGLDDLRRVLAVLPAEQAEVLTMRFIEDMQLAEIAQALDIPVGTVKSRLHHALRALRESPGCRRYFLE